MRDHCSNKHIFYCFLGDYNVSRRVLSLFKPARSNQKPHFHPRHNPSGYDGCSGGVLEPVQQQRKDTDLSCVCDALLSCRIYYSENSGLHLPIVLLSTLTSCALIHELSVPSSGAFPNCTFMHGGLPVGHSQGTFQPVDVELAYILRERRHKNSS